MIFIRPDYLIFMLIPTIVLFFFFIKKSNSINSIFDEKILEKLTVDNGSLGRMGRNFMIFIALILMIVALSRPAIEKGDVKIKGKKIDMLIALDISKSMMASDIYPNRLEFAKKKIYEFIDSFKEANVGVVAFSSDGFLVSPMTQDSTTLKYLIGNLSLDSLSTSGTNLLIPIKKAKTFLKDAKQKIVIIFTDGGDNETFKEELEAAANANVHVYIYATATNAGSPITENGVSIKDTKGNIVITKLNDKIKKLAIESGGAYIVGGLKDDSISILVNDIKKKFELQDNNSRKIKQYKELFYYPLALSLLFMLFSFSSFPKKSHLAVFILLALSIHQDLQAGVFDFQTINKANEAYKNSNYKEAIKGYKELSNSKKSPQSFYDLANAQYKDKKYKQALSTYNKISSKDKNLEYKKLFNSANTLFQLKKYEDALKTYEKAKKIKNESDLEHNVEVTKKMIEKKKQKQKKKKKDNKDNKDDKKKNKDKDKQKKNDKKDAKEKDKKEPKDGDKDKESNEKSEEKKQKQKKEEKISEKEARKWEQQLEKRKPKTMPMKFQNYNSKRRENEKPW